MAEATDTRSILYENLVDVGELPGMDEMEPENFTQAQEGKSLSEPSLRSRDISTGQGERNKKPSVRKELNQIKKEKEAGRTRNQKDRSRGKRPGRKKMKGKEKGR